VTRAFEQFLDAVLPTSCIGCKSLGSHICTSCSINFQFQPHRVSRASLQGLAITELGPPALQLISAIKDQGRTQLLGALAEWMADGLEQLAAPAKASEFALAPIPSSKRALARRGFNPVLLLAQKVSRRLGMQLDEGLRLARQPNDQRELGVEQRKANLDFAMRYQPGKFGSKPLILIDDVVTTGATLLEARRAVLESAASVVGFIAFAETRERQGANSRK